MFLVIHVSLHLKQLGQYSQSHGRHLQAMRKRKGCNSKLCKLAGLVVQEAAAYPPCQYPACLLLCSSIYHHALWKSIRAILSGSICLSHVLQPFVFVLRMRSHQMRPQSRPPTPPPPLPVPPLAPPLTQPRALALSRRALTRLRRGLQLVTWYTDNCAVRCDGHSVMHD